MDFIIVIAGLLEILSVIFYIFFAIRNKAILSNKTLLYVIPVYVATFLLYSAGYMYAFPDYIPQGIASSANAALKALTFEVKSEYFKDLASVNIVFKIEMYISIALSGISLISGALGVFRNYILNNIRLINRQFKNADIVIGDTDKARIYIEKNPNVILLVNSKKKRLSRDEINELAFAKIPYVNKPLSTNVLKNVTRFGKGHKHILYFSEKGKYDIAEIANLVRGEFAKNDLNIHFHFESDSVYKNHIEEILNTRKGKNVMASCFNVNTLIAHKFSLEHNLAKYLPKGLISNCLLSKESKINVIFIGCDDTNHELFRNMYALNQFVTLSSDKSHYESNPINYHFFDKADDAQRWPIIEHITRENESAKDFPNIDNFANIHIHQGDAFSSLVQTQILKLINAQDATFNYLIIGLSNNFETANIASFFSRNSKSNIKIFMNLDDKKEAQVYSTDSKVIPFGFKNQILDHNILANDDFFEIALMSHNEYLRLKRLHGEVSDEDFQSLPFIKKMSNIYLNYSLEFKLNLLGFTTHENGNPISKNEYLNAYLADTADKSLAVLDYMAYFKRSIRNSLAFQEHSRWCAFYMSQLYTQMSKKDIRIDGSKVIWQNNELKEHACLTSYLGLDELNKYIVEQFKTHLDVEKPIQEIEAYRYDFELMDELASRIESGLCNVYRL